MLEAPSPMGPMPGAEEGAAARAAARADVISPAGKPPGKGAEAGWRRALLGLPGSTGMPWRGTAAESPRRGAGGADTSELGSAKQETWCP